MADLFERILLLKRTPVFSAVMTGDLRLVAQELTEEAFFAGERVFDINDPSDRLYLITDGRIGISLHADPAVKDFIATLGPRECFGEMGLFDDQLRSATAHVLEDTEVLTLDTNRLHQLIIRYPELALGMLKGLSMRLRETNKNMA